MAILRSARSRCLVCAFAVGFASWVSSASAATQSFSYPTISLPGTGNPTFYVSFVLPRDYQNEGTVTIVLYLSTAAGPCTARLVPVQLVRKRLGEPIVNSLDGTSTASFTVGFSGSAVRSKSFMVDRGFVMDGQRRGDALTLQITREAGDPTDTCDGPVFVQAIDIRYPGPE
jgi:hypothetical protein